jgi:hypothetical protein
MRRAARLFELIQRSRRIRVVTVRSLADIAICARHRKVRVGGGLVRPRGTLALFVPS